MTLLWYHSSWRPALRYNLTLARSLFGFSIWVTGEGILNWFYSWGEHLVIGRFLGIEALGIYVLGRNIINLFYLLLRGPITTLLYPAFCRLQDDRVELKRVFHRTNQLLILLNLPLAVGLFLTGPHLAAVVFGDQWQGLGIVLSVMGLAVGLSALVGPNAELYRAIGRPDINVKIMIGALIIYFPLFIVSAQAGLEAFVWMRAVLTLAIIPVHVFLCMRMLAVSPWYLWRDGKPAIQASLLLVLVVAGVEAGLNSVGGGVSELGTLSLMITLGILTYGSVLWLLDRSFILQTANLLKRAVWR
jgi:O-antigen/teichoic acid export membrane protein